MDTSLGSRAIVMDEKGRVLLVRHQHGSDVGFWVPPGGGLEPGETLIDCAVREVHEETGLEIEVERFLYIEEGYVDGVHGVGCWVLGRVIGGDLKLGIDPELGEDQILSDVRFVHPSEFSSLDTLYPDSVWWQSLLNSVAAGFSGHRFYQALAESEERGKYLRTGWL